MLNIINLQCFCFVLFRLVYPKLSASLHCHFWIALWYSLTFSYRRLTFLPNCIWTPTFSAKHNNLASVVWHTSLMLFHFNTVTTNFNGEGKIYPYRSLRIVVCPFVPLLSFFGPLHYMSFFDLRIVITLWYISPLTYVWSSFLAFVDTGSSFCIFVWILDAFAIFIK